MDIDAYLERIGYRGSRAPSPQTLRELQVAHLLTVPFENLSIHAGEPIVLRDEDLFEKVVTRRRGGFCYELNGLFAALLRALGFEVTLLSARVARTDGGYSPEFDHMTLRVSLERPWLVDVGFGDTFRYPLALDERGVQPQIGRGYRLSVAGEALVLEERKDAREWRPQYRFEQRPYGFADFVPRCNFHQTSPASHFRRGRVCSRATEDGRLTLSEMSFVVTTLDGDRDERTLDGEAAFARVLAARFGIVMRGRWSPLRRGRSRAAQ